MTSSMLPGILFIWHAFAMASKFEPSPEIRTTIFFML